MEWKGKSLHIDPVSDFTDYSEWDKADIILITHEHGDHLDPIALENLISPDTVLIMNPSSAEASSGIDNIRILQNGEDLELEDIRIEAVPARNTTPGREKFHPPGRDNGYVLSFGSLRVYVAGDTEPLPEMENLRDISIAFLPVNQPYTMTPAQAREAAGLFHPAILIPYHYGETTEEELANLFPGAEGPEVRIRDLS
ncbi:MAG: MBL fold metallo-hydrolase [Spirochaetales bacterium]|nr:MBL fold metallo-hydrolase [Spirochaetales bacterium]